MTLPTRKICRTLTVALLGISVMACSHGEDSDWASLLDLAKKSWSGGDHTVSLKQASDVPYASIGVRIGDQGERMMVLAANNGADLLWTSSSKLALSTNNGRITRAIGFENDLTGFTAVSGDMFANTPTAWASIRHLTWMGDFAMQGLYSVEVSCTDTPIGNETIQILGQNIQTMRVDESCEAHQIGWRFVNQFWVDTETGAVWRSVQHINPKLDPIQIEILRPF